MNILFTICGRAGSKGVKNKNIREFLGYPLVDYTLAAIELFKDRYSMEKCDIVLNTDCVQMLDIVQKNKDLQVTWINRRKELCGDTVPKILVVHDCLKQMEEQKGNRYDVVIDLDITSPLRRIKDIRALIEKYSSGLYDVVFSVTESRRNPYFNMVKEQGDGCKRVIDSEFTARQQAPAIYDMNASMYAYLPEFLRMEKGIFDGKCGMISMIDTAVLDIDNENDFELMQIIGKYLFEKNEDFGEVFHKVKMK